MKKDLAISAMQPKIDELSKRNAEIDGQIQRHEDVIGQLKDERAINYDLLAEYAEIAEALDAVDENREVTPHVFEAESGGVWGHGLCMAMVMRNGGGDQCGLPAVHRLHLGGDE